MIIELTKISRSFDNILELGSGTGLLTRKIAKNIIFKEFYANDLVEKSQFYVKKYIPDSNFLYGNALKIKSSRKMDLIISNAMFQWFGDLEKGIDVISGYLANDGILAFSTFTPENFRQVREITGLALNYKTKEEIETILNKLGFEILFCKNYDREMKFNNALEILAHMKKTGVNSLSEKTWSMKKIKDFCEKYAQIYPDYTLTYSPLIVIAKRK
jgi:malonyl-ACP O-methyltransferase BioC